MPELIPSTNSAAGLRAPGFDPSVAVAPNPPWAERPSQRYSEDRIAPSIEHKTVPADAHGSIEVDLLERDLFAHRAQLKEVTSRVAMHLSSEERRSLFSAIDRLLDAEHWEDESSKIDDDAFRSFLRFMIFAHPRRIPNLGVGPDGPILAGWHAEGKSVYVEFLSEDQCVAVIRLASERGPERIAFRGHVAHLRDLVRNNSAIECFD